jgi:hypothetical protein
MILKEFVAHNPHALKKIKRAWEENYNYSLNYNTLTRPRARKMKAIAESRATTTSNLNDRLKYKLIAESLELWMQANIQTELTKMVAEGLDDESMEEAKVILAAKELSDKIQGMIEDAAKMQVQDLLPIVDAMKSEIGSAEAEAFSTAAESALAGLVEVLKTSKTEYDNAISAAQGQTPATDMDADMSDMDADMSDMDTDMDADMDDVPDDDMEDEFGGDAASAGVDTPIGRELKDNR